MLIQNRDGSIMEELPCDTSAQPMHYYAAVPAHMLDERSSVIERIIGLAFDALGVRHLEVRVYDAEEVCS